MKNYFIKDGYCANEIPITNEKFSHGLYWNKSRINASRVYQYSVYKDAIDIARENKIKTLCDVGCGTGEKLKGIHHAIKDINIVGIDQKHAIDYCLENHKFGKWLVDDFSQPKLNVRSEMTICSDVIEHLIDPDVLLNYLKRITVPGGLILISTPDRDRLRGTDCSNSPNKQHIREWNFSEFSAYLKSHDFTLLKHYHAPAVKLSISKIFIKEVLNRFFRGEIIKYNQIVLAKNPNSFTV